MPVKARIVLVTPALADANNGNWQTAWRWSRFLARDFRVLTCREWAGEPAEAMIALHARRSAPSISAFARAGGPVAVVLTGTDLYRDIRIDVSAQRSLALATRLVVLQSQGFDELPPECRERAVVIHQSARALAPGHPRARSFDLALVGHLRAEKDPLTAVAALGRLESPRLRLLHAGQVPDDALGRAFRAAAATDSRIELRGPLPHAAARQLIRHSRALLLPSSMEGGANVAIEAITAGVPVLASHIGGSTGLLGNDYPGFFPTGDDCALAALIARCLAEPRFLDELRGRCAARARLFTPERERDAVLALAHNLLSTTPEDRS